MALEPSLKRWTEAGLIQPEQAERILHFEKERSRPTLLYAIAGLAGLAMAIGIVSIVAANWDEIGKTTKLAIDVLLMAGLGALVLRLRQRGPAWLAEVSILVLYGLTLASIALIGQLYQLGGNAAQALAIWTAFTAVLMAQSRSVQLAFIWIAGVELTYFTGLAEIADDRDRLEGLALMAIYWPALAGIALGRAGWLARFRPELGRVCSALGWGQLVFLASAGTLAFYERPTFDDQGWFWLGAAVSAAGTAALCATTPGTPRGWANRALLVAAFAAAHLGILIPHGDWPVAAALVFIGVWWVAAVAAHRGGRRFLLHFATAMIGIRLLVVYFEVFGTLLDTGIALLIGGVLTLLMTWFWARKRRELDRELAAAEKESPK